jgi:hypothetical protein
MNLIVEALTRLNIKEYTLRGEPTTEDEFLAGFKKVTGEDSDGYAIETSDASKFGVTWSQIQTALANGGVVAMAELRVQRTMKLMESDWMSNSDVTMSDAWKNYRTALRNLPANNTNASWDGETLGNVTWPTKPS